MSKIKSPLYIFSVKSYYHTIFLAGVLTTTSVIAGGDESKPDANLLGVSEIRITMSQITPDAISCGLSLEHFRPVLKNQLQANGLKLVSSTSTLLTLGLMTTLDMDRSVCGTSATLGVYRKVAYYDDDAGGLRNGYVVLWQRGQQVMSGTADHAEMTTMVVQQLSEKLIESWRAENSEDGS